MSLDARLAMCDDSQSSPSGMRPPSSSPGSKRPSQASEAEVAKLKAMEIDRESNLSSE